MPPAPPADRDAVLALPDDRLLALCRCERTRGTGRGGQKRNRTESAVRVVYEPTGMAGESDATRSQHTNRRLALRQLRHEMALAWRQPPRPGPALEPRPNPADARYAPWLARLLDALEAAGYRVSDAAAALGLSTGRLVRLLAADTAAWQRVNQARQQRGLSLLRDT